MSSHGLPDQASYNQRDGDYRENESLDHSGDSLESCNPQTSLPITSPFSPAPGSAQEQASSIETKDAVELDMMDSIERLDFEQSADQVVNGASSPDDPEEEARPEAREMSYIQLFLLFIKFGIFAWGGPMAQIDMLKSYFVDERKWVSKSRFNRVLAVYQALPGPEATELACYFGMLSRGRPGSVLSGLGFLLPGFLLMLLISFLYVQYGVISPIVQRSMSGMQPVVAAMVVRAVHRISETALVEPDYSWTSSGQHAISIPLILLAVFSAFQSVIGISFFITLIYGGLLFFGFQGIHYSLGYCFPNLSSKRDSSSPLASSHQPLSVPASHARTFVFLLLLVGGIILTVFLYSTGHLNYLSFGVSGPSGGMIASKELWALFVLGLLAGLLTFGGAYTAIPFVQQDAVIVGQWLSPQAFLDGIALTQMIPTPLVMFSTFVGYLGNGFPGAVLMTVGMFLPAFSFTLIGHHFFETVVQWETIRSFLDGVTAAVMGLIAVTAVQLIKETVVSPASSVLFGLALAIIYAFKSPWTSPLLVISAGIGGEVLFAQ